MKRLIFNHTSGSARMQRRGVVIALSALAMLGMAQSAKADTAFNFSFSGSGITTSGVMFVSSTPDAAGLEITGIKGTFSDANNGFSGSITGLEAAPLITTYTGPGTFSAPAFTTAGFSYDDIFYSDGSSPAVCIDALAFYGGLFDIYGVVFDMSGGYTVDLWSQGVLGGYFVGDSLDGVKLGDSADGYNVAPTPEPSSLLLLGTGLSGVVAMLKRRANGIK